MRHLFEGSIMGAKKFFRRPSLCFLVMLERSGHRTASPRVCCEKLVRTASVDDAPWSQPSLRSLSGTEVSQDRPSLPRLSSAPLIPARPFGLGLRFDEALLVAPSRFRARSIQPTRETATSLAHCSRHRKRFLAIADRNAKRQDENTGLARKGEGGGCEANRPKDGS